MVCPSPNGLIREEWKKSIDLKAPAKVERPRLSKAMR
jgi:hypothetical protein